MADTTVIYYTSQREKPDFEERIRRALQRLVVRFRLPLISVSQFPLDFGQNICVGDVGTSPLNAFRQLQIGAMAAKTTYVCTAESDVLYPREYFRMPHRDPQVFQTAMPLWVLFMGHRRAKLFVRKMRGDAGAMQVGRERLIARIDEVLAGMKEWGTGNDGMGFPSLVDQRAVIRRRCVLPHPIVSFKTDQNMHSKTVFDRSSTTRVIPYWGDSHALIDRYAHGT